MFAGLLLYFADNRLSLDTHGLIDLGNAALCGVLILVFVHIYDGRDLPGRLRARARRAQAVDPKLARIDRDEPWLEDQVHSRLVLVSHLFPGITHDNVWHLPAGMWERLVLEVEAYREAKAKEEREARRKPTRARRR